MRLSGWRAAWIGVVCASGLYASPCATASLSTYIGLGATGCTINGVLVNDFNFMVVATSLGSPLTAGAITVTPVCDPTFTFQVCFTTSGNTPATRFMVTGTDFAKYQIDFNWDPVVIGSEDDMNANTPMFPGTATVTTKLCAGQLFGGGLCPTTSSPTNTLTVFNDGHPADAVPTSRSYFASGLTEPGTPIATTSLVDLETVGTGGSSQITGFNNALLTPEPGTLVLMAGGLAALLRRRFR